MGAEIIYMLGIILAGFAVNYTLRALPFLLFSGRDRELPGWVEPFGRILSPIIITLLVVYSYSGLAWKTAWPYLAGLMTVGLQLWRRNPLVSIVAGTLVYMCLLSCGCTTMEAIELDAQHPSVRYASTGVYFGNRRVAPQEVAEILENADIPHTRAVHIRLDPDVQDLRGARLLMGLLGRQGYTRCVLVTERHAESFTREKKKGKTSR